MFKPTSVKDRLNYGESLMPPYGYRLEHAVGTTYSLDLETLTGVSIALGLSEDTDSELARNPISLLSALQKVSDRIVVFCEAGQIKLPEKAGPLCLALEKMVVPVSLPYDRNIRRFPAFHPKTWLLEYSGTNGRKKYRFVVMSRNMTFDHSWDVACRMDGEPTESVDTRTKPIIDFLRFLRTQLNKKLANYERQNNDLEYITEALSSVRFQQDAEFSDFAVLPLGIGAAGYNMAEDSLLRENFHELVVMSPFLTGSVIRDLNRDEKSLQGTTRTLITRRTELTKLQDGDASNFDIYVMKDEVIDGESSESEDETLLQAEETEEGNPEPEGDDRRQEDELNKQDIHAKLYIRRKNNAVDLYLGSMNASSAAIHSNVEMMLRLRTRSNVLNGDKFLDDIMGPNRDERKNPFELVSLETGRKDEAPSDQDRAEQLIKQVCRISLTAEAVKNHDLFDLIVSAKTEPHINGITIRPLRCKAGYECGLQRTMRFQSLKMLHLSEFYVVSAKAGDCQLERVIMIPTSGIPGERDAEIIKDVIRSRRQFIEFIAFILGDDYIQSFLENQKLSGAYGDWGRSDGQVAVYEKMLRTAVTDPARLEEIQLITRAVEEEEIIPQEFRDMYGVFCDTLRIKQE